VIKVEALKKIIRDVPDFPKKGILFKDITTLLKDPASFQRTVDLMSHRYVGKHIDLVIGIEARGFVVGAALAYKLGAGVILVRKPGKLPHKTVSEEFEKEYGKDKFEMNEDAIEEGDSVLIIDDLLATCGTLQAAIKLVEKQGGKVNGIGCLIELDFLKGREKH